MAVESLGPIDLVASLEDIERAAPDRQPDTGDSVDLSTESTESRVVAELDAAMEIARKSPDVRADLVADVQARLKDPNYLSATVIDRIAERIQRPLGA